MMSILAGIARKQSFEETPTAGHTGPPKGRGEVNAHWNAHGLAPPDDPGWTEVKDLGPCKSQQVSWPASLDARFNTDRPTDNGFNLSIVATDSCDQD